MAADSQVVRDLTKEYLVEGRGLSGLGNMGNTCFMNSALFALLQTEPLVRYFLSQQFREDMNPKKREHEMARQLYMLTEAFWSENCTILPKSFKRILGEFNEQYHGWMQHDAHEVLIQILTLLHEGLSYKVRIGARGSVETETDRMELESIRRWSEIYKDEYSIIIETFYGQYHSEIICASCRTPSSTYDPFCAIELPITGVSSLERALEAFLLEEVLADEWSCEHCQTRGRASKRVSLWKLPPVLIITLKRFSFTERGGMKDSHLVTFPQELHMPREGSRIETYELQSVVNHTGGINGGHYYAYSKTLGGNWYEFNDQKVSRVGALVTPAAYVLFYQRRR